MPFKKPERVPLGCQDVSRLRLASEHTQIYYTTICRTGTRFETLFETILIWTSVKLLVMARSVVNRRIFYVRTNSYRSPLLGCLQ
jgi:hypothetical protein